ncbi:hypothetical protein [Francisella orientalis]|uniref:hypothetical protein n=1 Tax=Francisella orientalis TaxID=299583 RepID=UPI0035565709
MLNLLLVAKGKILNYFFAFVNNLTYAYILLYSGYLWTVSTFCIFLFYDAILWIVYLD